jgi:hypothetical protein
MEERGGKISGPFPWNKGDFYRCPPFLFVDYFMASKNLV